MAGTLISFEGVDGSGKTTQIDMLCEWLYHQNEPFFRTCEPGGTRLGEIIRDILWPTRDLDISPLAEAFLFQADRAQHFHQVVLPALCEYDVVIVDRCYDSSAVYQGVVQNIGLAFIDTMSMTAMGDREPDLTILLDMPAELVHERKKERMYGYDAKDVHFHEKARQAYLALARSNPHMHRIRVIDATQTQEAIHEQVVRLVGQCLDMQIAS